MNRQKVLKDHFLNNIHSVLVNPLNLLDEDIMFLSTNCMFWSADEIDIKFASIEMLVIALAAQIAYASLLVSRFEGV